MNITTTAATMTSREIAELVESRHDSVKRTIERLSESGVIVRPPMVDEHSEDSMGRTRIETVYCVGERDSYVIVAQLSPAFTARLVDRWQELEAGAAPALPRTFAEALRALADQTEANEKQAKALALAAPKVAFVERYVESTGNLGFREVAKLLKANEARLREWLLAEKIMYRLAGHLVPHQNHIDAGRFVVKTGSSDGGHAFTQTKATPKGVEFLAAQWAVHQLHQPA